MRLTTLRPENLYHLLYCRPFLSAKPTANVLQSHQKEPRVSDNTRFTNVTNFKPQRWYLPKSHP